MKLLIYSHYFAPSVGGVEAITLSLARGLAELQRSEDGTAEFEITVVTQTPAGQFDDCSLPFRVVRLPSVPQLWQLVRWSDAIHLAGPSLLPLLFGRISGKPVVIEHHGYQAICPNGLLIHKPDGSVCPGHFVQRHYGECAKCLTEESPAPRNWTRVLQMFPRYLLARSAAANIAVSNYALNRSGLPHSAVIYHGIDDPLPATQGDETRLTSNKISFGFVGRLVTEKGLPVLLEASRLLREEGRSFEVLLIGDGPERAKLEAVIVRDRLEPFVRITGFLTRAALAEALGPVQVVVMPSVWEESAGLAAIEQMMRGRLVIASDIGGLGEVIGEAGLKCAAGDAKALADAMRKVLLQPSIVNSLGEAARARALTLFRREHMIAEHVRVYRGLMELKTCPN